VQPIKVLFFFLLSLLAYDVWAISPDEELFRKGKNLIQLRQFAEARRAFNDLILEHEGSKFYELAQDELVRLDTISKVSSSKVEPSLLGKKLSKEKRGKRIVIDPGHGGHDVGAVSEGLKEKEITLAVSLRLHERLLKAGYESILTRDEDIFLPLSARTDIANQYQPEVFISVHVNASSNGKLSGYQTFYLDNTDDKNAKALAARENSSLGLPPKEESDIQFMISDLLQTGKTAESIHLGHQVHDAVLEVAGRKALQLKKKGISDLNLRKAPFYVLVGTDTPSILVELLFINHPHDRALLKNPDFLDSLADGLKEGIIAYLGKP
jgi:N-acetylmuramoyl-L-alanine amidase